MAKAFDVYCLMDRYDGRCCYPPMENLPIVNNSPDLAQCGFRSATPGLNNVDHHSPAYNRLQTTEIKMCLNDTQQCHTFVHQFGISLQEFFTTGTTYTESSYRSVGYADTGNASALTQFESNMGHLSVAISVSGWVL